MERLIHKLLLQCGEIIQIQISLQFVMDSKFFKYQPGGHLMALYYLMQAVG